MACNNSTLLLRLMGGRLDDPAAARLEAHLAHCPPCRDELAELRRIEGLLGEWTVPTDRVNLREPVLAGAAAQPGLSTHRIWAKRMAAARVAASVLLAMGLGILAGALVPVYRGPSAPSGGVSAEVVLDSMGIRELGRAAGTGLAAGFDLPAEGQEAGR
jgi:anti-sigma factor RsiW